MENSDIKPSTIMLIAGGAVMALSTFLDWFGSDFGDASAWETEIFGLFGIVVFVIGIAIGGGVAAQQFGNVKMPDMPLGFTHDQIHFILGLVVFVPTISYFLGGPNGIGILLAFVSAGVIIAGSIMDMRSTGADDAAPTQF